MKAGYSLIQTCWLSRSLLTAASPSVWTASLNKINDWRKNEAMASL